MKYCFDLDNTLCVTNGNDYSTCIPVVPRINHVNNLYNAGHEIIIYTARGMGTFKGNVSVVYDQYYELTKTQLKNWGLKHTTLILGKPSYDMLICDKAFNTDEWFKSIDNPTKYKVGIIAGAFDVIHPGYIQLFEFCKQYCDQLVVALHEDPSIENKKVKPVLTSYERKFILTSLRNVDGVIAYKTEYDLVELLSSGKFNVRFLGEDYIDKDYTGKNLDLPVIFTGRSHGWSASKYKKLIYEQFKN